MEVGRVRAYRRWGREGSFDMVVMFEVVFLVLVLALGVRWYLRTPMHRARKRSGVQLGQVAGHGGFGMSGPSTPTPPPQALHDLHGESKDK
jgi:hypothetical protein